MMLRDKIKRSCQVKMQPFKQNTVKVSIEVHQEHLVLVMLILLFTRQRKRPSTSIPDLFLKQWHEVTSITKCHLFLTAVRQDTQLRDIRNVKRLKIKFLNFGKLAYLYLQQFKHGISQHIVYDWKHSLLVFEHIEQLLISYI